MNHIIFSDVDGTIYGAAHHLLPETSKDVAFAQKNGFEFIVATGNPYFAQMRWLANELNVNYIISSNGAEIFDVKNNKAIFKNYISKEKINEIIIKANELKLGSNWWSEENALYVNGFNAEKLQGFWKIHDPEVEIIKLSSSESDCAKIEFYVKEDEAEALVTMQNYIEKMDLHVAKMSATHIEVTANNTSKGNAVKWLLNYLNGDIKKTMAIGDSANDITMLEIVEHSYAMDNAPLRIKEITDHFASDVLQNGLGEAIRDFMFRVGFRD